MRRLVALASIEVAVVLVTSIAVGALGDLGPATWRGEAMRRWYADASADTLLAAAGLAVVVAIAGWLALATGLQALAELVPATPLRNVADRVAPAVLRSVGRTVAEVTLGASVLLAPVSVTLSAGPPALALVDDQPGTATLRPVAPVQPPAGAPGPDPAPGPAVADPVATTPVAGSAAASVVVTTGDSFWSIADEVLSSRLGRPSSDAETDGYWRALMERNADRLVVPGNFDLIYPGQVLALPDGDPTGGPPRLAETL